MLLSKSLFEATPYLLIGAAAYMLLALPLATTSLAPLQFYLLLFAALLLFHSGVLVWVKRSQNRGGDTRHFPSSHYRYHWKPLDQPIDTVPIHRHIAAPFYEYQPFGYLLIAYGCLLMSWLQPLPPATLMWQFSAALLLTAGLLVWIMRGFYRGYHASHHQPATVHPLS